MVDYLYYLSVGLHSAAQLIPCPIDQGFEAALTKTTELNHIIWDMIRVSPTFPNSRLSSTYGARGTRSQLRLPYFITKLLLVCPLQYNLGSLYGRIYVSVLLISD